MKPKKAAAPKSVVPPAAMAPLSSPALLKVTLVLTVKFAARATVTDRASAALRPLYAMVTCHVVKSLRLPTDSVENVGSVPQPLAPSRTRPMRLAVATLRGAAASWITDENTTATEGVNLSSPAPQLQLPQK